MARAAYLDAANLSSVVLTETTPVVTTAHPKLDRGRPPVQEEGTA
jgi:hypothetical protein